MRKKAVRFTNHAIMRLAEIGYTAEKGFKLFEQSRRYKLGLKHHFYKLIRYGAKYKGFEYWEHRGKHILFTARNYKDEKVIITVTPKY